MGTAHLVTSGTTGNSAPASTLVEVVVVEVVVMKVLLSQFREIHSYCKGPKQCVIIICTLQWKCTTV